MTKTKNSRTGILKTAAGGWVAGLGLISLFVFGINDPAPEWGSYWQVRPLLLTPVIAGTGAGFAYLLFNRGGGSAGRKLLFTVLAASSFLFCLWIGVILGLDGTLWD